MFCFLILSVHSTIIVKNESCIEANGIVTNAESNKYAENTKIIIFREELKEIGERGFMKFIRITEVKIPDNCQKIGVSAFALCSNLISCILPLSLVEISERTFESCNELRFIDIKNNVKIIGENAFLLCNNLNYVVLPNSLKEIKKNAFSRCFTLEKIYFCGVNQPQIGENAFSSTAIRSVGVLENYTNANFGGFNTGNFKKTKNYCVNKPNPASKFNEEETEDDPDQGNFYLTKKLTIIIILCCGLAVLSVAAGILVVIKLNNPK